jgi:hypothetical protein
LGGLVACHQHARPIDGHCETSSAVPCTCATFNDSVPRPAMRAQRVSPPLTGSNGAGGEPPGAPLPRVTGPPASLPPKDSSSDANGADLGGSPVKERGQPASRSLGEGWSRPHSSANIPPQLAAFLTPYFFKLRTGGRAGPAGPTG